MTCGTLLEQVTELAEKDSSVLTKLHALNDGTEQSVQLLPPGDSVPGSQGESHRRH